VELISASTLPDSLPAPPRYQIQKGNTLGNNGGAAFTGSMDWKQRSRTKRIYPTGLTFGKQSALGEVPGPEEHAGGTVPHRETRRLLCTTGVHPAFGRAAREESRGVITAALTHGRIVCRK